MDKSSKVGKKSRSENEPLWEKRDDEQQEAGGNYSS
jgi:hypothetical protein